MGKNGVFIWELTTVIDKHNIPMNNVQYQNHSFVLLNGCKCGTLWDLGHGEWAGAFAVSLGSKAKLALLWDLLRAHSAGHVVPHLFILRATCLVLTVSL